ncbi:unnamed protein product [Ilex paraguariensis]|uniref:Uncharacterized protein n=1 Tax=Ilex paraguariensis TaxID=185542 RepID=A0ABC8TPE8_9AQUA
MRPATHCIKRSLTTVHPSSDTSTFSKGDNPSKPECSTPSLKSISKIITQCKMAYLWETTRNDLYIDNVIIIIKEHIPNLKSSQFGRFGNHLIELGPNDRGIANIYDFEIINAHQYQCV